MTSARTKSRPRTASKEERREQLIKATIRSVARHGLPDTTTAVVAKEAGLSQGLINLHFKSKDRLLAATLRYLADEYRQAWERALAASGPSAAERLAAVIGVDFDKSVCHRNKLAVWFAFWGETKSRPTYRKLCAERDREYTEMLTQLCARIIAEGAYDGPDGRTLATGLSAMTEGLWLDLLMTPEAMDRERASEICFAYLARLFPRHFGRGLQNWPVE